MTGLFSFDTILDLQELRELLLCLFRMFDSHFARLLSFASLNSHLDFDLLRRVISRIYELVKKLRRNHRASRILFALDKIRYVLC